MKTLKKYEFKERGNGSSYDWEKILDGNIYKLEEGTDFTCAKGTVTTMARSRAAARGQTVKIAVEEDGVVIQATSEPDEEKAAEWKAHQKELNAARKARKEEEAAAA